MSDRATFVAAYLVGAFVIPALRDAKLDVPEQALSQVVALLGRLGAVVLETTASSGDARLVGHLRSDRVPDLASRLPDLTGGEGVLVSRLDHHAPATGTEPPTRLRRGPDPADREAWFRDVPR